MRSEKAVTIFRSRPTIDGPFYSGAMQCWRIQFYQRGETYHYSRESSFWIERVADAEIVGKLTAKVETWEEWCELPPKVKEALAHSATGGYCYVSGIGIHREALHQAFNKNDAIPFRQ